MHSVMSREGSAREVGGTIWGLKRSGGRWGERELEYPLPVGRAGEQEVE